MKEEVYYKLHVVDASKRKRAIRDNINKKKTYHKESFRIKGKFKQVPIIVLPIYQAGGQAILWEDSNPWREAWRRLEIKNELVNLMVPIGQLADVMAINAEQALEGDRKSLRKFAMSYGAEETLVAVASLSSLSSDQISVDVTIQNFGITVGALGIERFEMQEVEMEIHLVSKRFARSASPKAT